MIFEEQVKQCSKCKTQKNYSLFSKRNGKPDSWCKACYIQNAKRYAENNKEHVANAKKLYAIKNKERIAERIKAYVEKNREHIRKKQKEYTRKNKHNKTTYDKQYYQQNKEIKREQCKVWRRNKKQTDAEFRFKCNISKQFWQLLSDKEGKNGLKTVDILAGLGYTLEQLKSHITKQFKEGMSWENYGKWHLDHIKPVCAFSFSKITDEGFKQCWGLQNLQPLWAADNLKKISSDKKQSLKRNK